MQIKNYIVSDMSEAMRLIREELGPEAFIVSQREVKQKGLFGSFKRKKLEVTAAKESKPVDGIKRKMVKPNNKTFSQKVVKLDEKVELTKSESTITPNEPEVNYEKLISDIVQKTLQTQQTVETENLETIVPKTMIAQSTSSGMNYQKGLALNKFMENSQIEVEQEGFKPLDVPILQNKKTLEELIFDDIPRQEDNEVLLEEKQIIKLADDSQMSQTEKLQLEVLEIKNMLRSMLREEEPVVVDSNLDVRLHYLLRKYDFSETFIQSFKHFIEVENLEGNELNSLLLKRFLKNEIEEKIMVDPQPLNKVNIFVGPPGVGKTTTIAKIASNEILNHNKKVGLITVDTYRIGAVEQLKTYANILNTPIKVVYTVEDMKQALYELQDCDLIIIDSIGRTHKDFESLEELKHLFEGIKNKHTHLVLSLSTKFRQIEKIIDNYEMLDYDHLLFTKLDECDCNENIMNVYYKTSKPLTYLCMGQEVPDDIMLADKSKLLSLILGGEGHG